MHGPIAIDIACIVRTCSRNARKPIPDKPRENDLTPIARVFVGCRGLQDRPALDPAQRCLSDKLEKPRERQSGEAPELARDRGPSHYYCASSCGLCTTFDRHFTYESTSSGANAALVLRLGILWGGS
jgi:hypothetical protein